MGKVWARSRAKCDWKCSERLVGRGLVVVSPSVDSAGPVFPQDNSVVSLQLSKNRIEQKQKKQKLVYLIRTATALESSLPVVYCSLNRCVDLDRPDSANRGRQNDERKEPDRRRRPASCWVPPLNGFRPSSLHSSPARKCPDGNAVKASYGKRCQNRWDRLARHTTPVVS